MHFILLILINISILDTNIQIIKINKITNSYSPTTKHTTILIKFSTTFPNYHYQYFSIFSKNKHAHVTICPYFLFISPTSSGTPIIFSLISFSSACHIVITVTYNHLQSRACIQVDDIHFVMLVRFRFSIFLGIVIIRCSMRQIVVLTFLNCTCIQLLYYYKMGVIQLNIYKYGM